MSRLNAKGSLLAGTLAAIGASACCLGPLVLLSLGFGGAWIGRLTAMALFRPAFMAAALLFLALAFRELYFPSRACEPGSACRDKPTLKRQRLIFWGVALLSLGLLAGPWAAPLFY
ncbi:mercuric ion transport protein [Methylomagnum ishizawai]|uniref:Mercuric transport protein MerT n=1 Tax=Methylomagnum ishizawai TaxID=1760988 RepID=A0A1Y6CXE4_9GAMM|nr:mercuric transporter MerT family protein [Methylomagnum ishizawai]SMF95017.1 mercuric ion transport protein [Methylomagnum ishizawai]